MSDRSNSVFLSNNLAVNPGEGGRAWSSNCFNFVSTPAILFDCVSAHPVLHPGGGAVLGASGDRLPGGYPGGGYPAGSACPN